MRFLKILLIILLFLGAVSLLLFVSGNSHLFKGAWATYLHGYSTASIGDKRFFETRAVAPSSEPFAWFQSTQKQADLSSPLREMLENTRSIAFLVLRGDTLLYEEYWDDHHARSKTNSFSMAKSITTLLVQIAIQEGIIGGWDDKVVDYLPEIQGPYREELLLKHLSTMSAGLQWEESYSGPLGITAKAYYGSDVVELMYDHVPVVNQPGEDYNYQSGATQLLGMVLRAASGLTVADFASKHLWQPLQAENEARWHLDEKGMELTYCCFNSNARDFARFGRLMNNFGRWGNRQIIDSAFMVMATRPQLTPYYGYSFWIDTDDHLSPVYFMRGIHGQYVISIPEYDLTIVRLGHERLDKKRDEHPEDFHIMTEEVLKYFRTN